MNLNKQYYKRQLAFSLIEMLMALLVASLLMAALAPVMTRRMHDSMTISVEGKIPGKKTKTHEITYEDCLSNGGIEKEEKDLITGKVISRYCEGEFTIPYGYNGNMKVTAIGAGGGGGVSSTAGYIEYTTEGSTNTFTVPNLINKLEATLISGGAGGGAGGQVTKTQTFVLYGNGGITKNDYNNITIITSYPHKWEPSMAVKDRNILLTACGGGGGGGGFGGGGGGGGGGLPSGIGGQRAAIHSSLVGGECSINAAESGSSTVTIGDNVSPSKLRLIGGVGLGGCGGVSGVGGGSNWGGSITTPFGNGYCGGGAGGNAPSSEEKDIHTPGVSGQSGAMRITYLDYGPGGSGGGGAAMVPIQPVAVSPNETLSITLGKGGDGLKAGRINTDGTIIQPAYDPASRNAQNSLGKATYLKKEDKIVIATSTDVSNYAANSGCPTGTVDTTGGAYFCGFSGWVHNGKMYNANNQFSESDVEILDIKGFERGFGKTAGNTNNYSVSTFANGTTGGDGGQPTTPWFTCTPGKGGTKENPVGGNASGYGCGGGGGYGLSNGGKGAGGYARISWNKYWDTALNSGSGAYKYADTGTAGGGASGNIVVYTISNLKSGDKIKIRIGKGGEGASVNNNTITNAIKGGDTVFGQNKASIKIIAGGGNPGTNPSITGTHPDTTISNGTGGDINNDNNAYSFNNKNLTTQCNNTTTINNCYIKGLKGYDGASTKGGNGADLANNPKVLGKSNTGNTGGIGGTTGSNAKGNNAYDKGIGSGGGGAGILDIGTPTISTHNPNTGGNGSNGKILLEWWE